MEIENFHGKIGNVSVWFLKRGSGVQISKLATSVFAIKKSLDLPILKFEHPTPVHKAQECFDLRSTTRLDQRANGFVILNPSSDTC
jgi:hypothetical protein